MQHERTQAIIAHHGLTMDAALEKDRGHKGPSRWRITIRKGTVEWTTTYHMGAVHRELPERITLDGEIFPRRVTGRERAEYERARFKSARTLYEEALLSMSKPVPPKLPEVLWSLAMDAESVRHGQSLSEFGRELGYTDLQEGVNAYNGCLDEWRALVRFGLDLDELYEAVMADDGQEVEA